MTLQYLRQVRILVGNGKKALEITGLRVVFAIIKGDTQTPNQGTIKIYNLSKQSIGKIQKEFTRIVLEAGYKENFSLIFDGNVVYTRFIKENETDIYLEILASDGDLAYNFAFVNTSLQASNTSEDRIKALSEPMAEKGTNTGIIQAHNQVSLSRGKVMFGLSRDYMTTEAKNQEATWSIQDNKLTLLQKSSYLPSEIVVLTGQTGLIGMPEQTEKGINITCLLNPKLKIGGRVKLDNQSIEIMQTQINQVTAFRPKLDKDGIYRIIKLEYAGDTHGNDWYCKLMAVGIDDTMNMPLDMV